MPLPPRPDGPLRVLIDTDTANEIDDQFAIAWALLSPDRLTIEGIHAAPFCHGHYFDAVDTAAEKRGGERTGLEKVAGAIGTERRAKMTADRPAAEGEARSRAEIHRLLDTMNVDAPPVKAGSTRFMESPTDIVESEAARHLIERSHAGDAPLYVPTIGAPTNVAAALLMDPTIAEKIVVIFLAGYPTAVPHGDDSFNLVQDRHATNVLFESGVPLVYQPGYHVAEVLGFSLPDADRWLKGHGALGDLLHEIYVDNPIDRDVEKLGRSWVIWDIIAIAWLLDPSWAPTFETGRAHVTERHTWEPIDGRMDEAFRVQRGAIFADLLAKIHAHG
ncbi:MAG: nucleoside hydrolase [Acidimicrobiales bacterium]|jgi:inosine-uridine nucleoside N-ribohydrolase|nr:nucleoside hydrolase [Acidimicrobiales bacterium]